MRSKQGLLYVALGAILLVLAIAVPVVLTWDSDEPIVSVPAAQQAPAVVVSATGEMPAQNAPPGQVLSTADNPLMADFGLSAGACTMPEWSRFEKGVRAYFDGVFSCLNQKWQPVMDRVRLPWHAPKVEITLEIKKTDCAPGFNPYSSQHCQGTIYVVPDSYLKNSVGQANDGIVAIVTAAHEYGHLLQQHAGIINAAWQQRVAVGPDTPAGLEISRRVELQAQCFAGMFLGVSFDKHVIDVATQEQFHRGDHHGTKADHGRPEVYGEWFVRGVTRNRLADCNTFAAPAGEVS